MGTLSPPVPLDVLSCKNIEFSLEHQDECTSYVYRTPVTPYNHLLSCTAYNHDELENIRTGLIRPVSGWFHVPRSLALEWPRNNFFLATQCDSEQMSANCKLRENTNFSFIFRCCTVWRRAAEKPKKKSGGESSAADRVRIEELEGGTRCDVRCDISCICYWSGLLKREN